MDTPVSHNRRRRSSSSLSSRLDQEWATDESAFSSAIDTSAATVPKSKSVSSAATAHATCILRSLKFKSKYGCRVLSKMPLGHKGYSSAKDEKRTKNAASSVSASASSAGTPVFLNVYDLTPMNGYVYWAGLGIFHSGVEVYGVEYAFGAHDYPTSGVFEVEPRQCPGFTFRKSIYIGNTHLSPSQLRAFIERIAGDYNGDTYHLIAKNCNHFCRDVCFKLTGKSIPGWVNRLARIGSVCNCLLPKSLHVSAVRHEPEASFSTLVSIAVAEECAALGTEKVNSTQRKVT
eukprot:TRINITY_DN8717_c0_g1_i2.p1 TRINITY_DN8717_c0_g1~~TRINITY_DN8717_c0_g1_i2.p1  ORF type:complete len:289 (-),score=26.33 TRINITY_DN8717_c0_g1_i2:295-1161(-)